MDNWKREMLLLLKSMKQLSAEMHEINNQNRQKLNELKNLVYFDKQFTQSSSGKFSDCNEAVNKLRALNKKIDENLIRLKKLKF